MCSPMGSNHGDLFNKLISLVRWRYIVLHTEVNGTGVGDKDGIASGTGRSGNDKTGEAEVGRGRQHGVENIGREGLIK